MVHKRHVYFIGGFDPHRASSFYQTHKTELARYSQLSHTEHTISPRQRLNENCSRWTVHAEHSQGTTHTTFDYLAWDDIVRSRWARTPVTLIGQALRSFKDFVCSGAARKLYRIGPATVCTALFPYFLTLIAALAIAAVAVASHAWLSAWGKATGFVYAITALTTTLGALLAWRILSRTPMTWFLRVVDFANCLAHNESAALDARMTQWAHQIGSNLQANEADETIVIGYSAGSSLAVAALARWIRQDKTTVQSASSLTLLTLGNCVPVAASLPAGTQVRDDIAAIGQRAIRWVDFTAPIDWGSFPLADPVALYATAQSYTNSQRCFVSPQFHLLFDAATYQSIKKDKYHVHQLYLQCTQRIGRYDYFGMVYGHHSLVQRMFKS
jgi:pimeloyl-ACP methyl ester carboxylesterase